VTPPPSANASHTNLIPAVRLLYTVENVVVPLLERITRAVERDATAL